MVRDGAGIFKALRLCEDDLHGGLRRHVDNVSSLGLSGCGSGSGGLLSYGSIVLLFLFFELFVQVDIIFEIVVFRLKTGDAFDVI